MASSKNSVYKLYTVSNDGIKRERRSCPKCGEGVFLANHKDRQTCGKCGYTEFKKKEK
ncbi:MAG: 30S ribosomal protein S27ae [Halobacteriota archaeon]|nr:30S ribosomal protein S27ae [Halobacteriota archaeon]